MTKTTIDLETICDIFDAHKESTNFVESFGLTLDDTLNGKMSTVADAIEDYIQNTQKPSKDFAHQAGYKRICEITENQAETIFLMTFTIEFVKNEYFTNNSNPFMDMLRGLMEGE
jgi:hypothetical protein